MEMISTASRDSENDRMIQLAVNTLHAQLNNKQFTGQMTIEMNCKDGLICSITTLVRKNWTSKKSFKDLDNLVQ